MKVLLATDVFPPGSGGSGWSTYYLGSALSERGHSVRVIRPRKDAKKNGQALVRDRYGGLDVEWISVPRAPGWLRRLGLAAPYEEQMAARRMSSRAARLVTREGVDVLHGQHKVSAVAVVGACKASRRRGYGAVSVVTVRDYWPLCPASTRLFKKHDGAPVECRDCHRLRAFMRCAGAEGGGPLARLKNLARWIGTRRAAGSLATADGVVAVSRYVRDELAASGRVPGRRLHSIPNLVHLPSVERDLAGRWPIEGIAPDEPFALFAGKLDLNKGPQLLPEVLKRSGVTSPVVFAGDGPLRDSLAVAGQAAGLDFRFFDWLENDAVLRLMRSARLLLFPSAWQEPLSRVLLEASAVGAAIVALDTGGTAEVVRHMETGWLASDMHSFAEGVRRVWQDDDLNARLRQGARERARRVFSHEKVAAEVELLYTNLLQSVRDGA